MKKLEKRENWKKQTPYDIVANTAVLLILDGIFGLVMRIMYTASEGFYFSTIVMAIASLFLLLSGVIGLKVREEHEKLNLCFILFIICVITYVISLVLMGMEDADFEEALSGIMITVFLFLLWGVLIARAYIFKRKGGSDKGNVESA
ncbi:MAG: hypothetical protein HFH90_16075 [Lachnospiraceae bacterium]|jgi:hypothetical protein|nr:hypothetical protein [Lachnospiraceae bacterium]